MATRVFVGRLNYDVRERDLERFFRGYGRIEDIVLKNGFGFVDISDYRDAEDAVRDLNGKRLMGERVTVELARGMRRGPPDYDRGPRRFGPPTRTNYQLLVENLSTSVSWQDLKDFMRQAGDVTYTDAHKLRRHQGVVEFASYSDMKNALRSLDNVSLDGRRIRLVETKRLQRRSSRSSSRSRSPRRSRSTSRQRQSSGRRRSSSGSERASARRRSRSSSRRPSSSRSRSGSKSPRRVNNSRRSRSKSPRSPAKRRSSRSSSRERGVSPDQNPSGTEQPADQADCKAQENNTGPCEEASSSHSPSGYAE
uniref:Putative alternative splicing factor asf/sf2 n=1 Tax=Rhipicephalus pulchellus TaxID=72859 RepID=L7LQG8_RHIPC